MKSLIIIFLLASSFSLGAQSIATSSVGSAGHADQSIGQESIIWHIGEPIIGLQGNGPQINQGVIQFLKEKGLYTTSRDEPKVALLYPVPCEGILHVQLEVSALPRFTVLNGEGKVLDKGQLASKNTTFYYEHFAPGQYFFILERENAQVQVYPFQIIH